VGSEVDADALLQSVGDAVVLADAEGRIVYWNPAAERLFGYTEEEALAGTLDLIVPERFRARHWEGYVQTVATGTTRYASELLRVPAVRKDGERISIAFTVGLLSAPDGSVAGVVAVVRDDTAVRGREQELRRRIEELETAAT
jgi:PAS domain S-box-containing protein